MGGEATRSETVTADDVEDAAGTSMFPHVGRWSRGYEPDQVDRFFAKARIAYEGSLEGSLKAADVRGIAFDLVRGGYTPADVDAALDRLEGAFTRRERASYDSPERRREWQQQAAERAATVYPRLARPAGERFSPPEHGRGYAAADVDALCDRLAAYFDTGAEITAAEVREATFRSARRDRAYAEGPVDAFLDRVVEVLLAVE